MRKIALPICIMVASAAQVAMAQSAGFGPFDAKILAGGIGIDRQIPAGSASATQAAPAMLSAWVNPDADLSGVRTLVAIGESGKTVWGIATVDGKLSLVSGAARFVSPFALPSGKWTHIAARSDGTEIRLFADGKAIGRVAAPDGAVAARFLVAPVIAGQAHFGGTLIGARLTYGSDPADLARDRPDFSLVHLWNVGAGWEWQNRANTGIWKPQDPWTLPQGKGGFSKPRTKPVEAGPVLRGNGADRWVVGGWRLAAAPDVKADGAALSLPKADIRQWYAATVPGTVLTTLIDQGVYPDPYYGLNNMAIPESLARQDYWYRTSFTVPPEAAGKALTLSFGGINYASQIWVNGVRAGGTHGAFIRGQIDFVPVAGENVVAVRVSPPPHPGTPHEQSIAAGVGENGGQLAIDGPTFVATEGWDWIPGIRDRNTGIWQPVELVAHGAVTIGDPQIITDLPLPRTDTADIHVTVPVHNAGSTPVSVTVSAGFEGHDVARTLTVGPGTTEVKFTPADSPALRVRNPVLWWPNGYGAPALHTMRFAVAAGGMPSDQRETRFGIREVSYDLSLFDGAGKLRRVTVEPTDGRLAGHKLIDVTHAGIKESPRGWAESLTPAGERSPGVRDTADVMPEPHLTIRVNGVRIAARGGSWGMDDALKRVSRDRLAPYFRLEREAHMNIVRNWMGNNYEDEFFDLADENGVMVLNDFWQSTQNFQVEPQDPALFVANARDVVARYRNHPSIIVWFGRNEGVPYPLLNEALDDVLFELDGTRWYTGSSNTVNLQGSGPYNYRPPAGYFTDLATGFSVETGTSSLSTLEAINASVPAPDRWPLSDTLAYHDWHFGGNGDTKTFMATLDTMFGAGTGIADFERKAQMMNLETHKAIYEGFLAHLWTRNSGRLLWMTHPSWPSNAWQLYSSDYDTSAAYYGAKKAAEPLHIQLNLPDNALAIVNTTRDAVPGLIAETRVLGLDNAALFTRTDRLDARANQVTTLPAIPLDRLFAEHPLVLVSLTLKRGDGTVVSDNFYWRGKEPANYRALDTLAQVTLDAAVSPVSTQEADHLVTVRLTNSGKVPALNTKLTLLAADGSRILPAYYSDNYVAVLPGETRTVTIRYPLGTTGTPAVALRGWNVAPLLREAAR